MGDKKKQQVDRMLAYARVLEKQAGKAVRPYRADGYMNLLNRYGTSKDSGEAYRFVPEATIPDESLTMFYESNGLFAKIIDAPAEEALKHGFGLDDVSDQEVEDFYREALDELDWEETAMTAIKWARLFGGSLAVMLINDGRGLEEPLDWKNIQSIDDIRVYDRSVIQPDYESMFHYDPRDPFRTRGSRLGMPERYSVYSRYGSFTVHESRCLVFQNGLLPENSSNSIYQFWGMPEYVRLHRAIQDAEVAHRSAPRMLDRSVQPVYKMKDLAAELATEEGETKVLKRLQTIDMARGMLNSITIDSEGEDYDFRSFQFAGVSDVIDSACNYLSALSNIPQTILFGRSPAGMNATGESDLENWYNFVERIQKRMLKSNLRYLLSVIFQAGVATGEVDEVPKLKVKFNPLWSLSDNEQADLDQKKAATAQVRAQTAQIYVDMQAIDPTEVRRKLADSSEFDVETLLDEYEDEDELMAAYIGEEASGTNPVSIFESGDFAEYAQGVDINTHATDPGSEGSAPANAPAATKLPQDMSAEEVAEAEQAIPEATQEAAKVAQNNDADAGYSNTQGEGKPFSVGVLVISEGKVLTGTRHNDFGYGLICGPGGHGEEGETPEQAAFRETEEEFGISPTSLIPLGTGPVEPDTGLTPYLFLCTEYEGEPDCVDLEMTNAKFRTLEELDQLKASLFQPFVDGIETLKAAINEGHSDGGPGSGHHGHAGVPGQVGGSAPSNASREVSHGKNLSGSYGGQKEIKSVLKAQGFDGLPKVVGRQEFDEAVKASSFIAQRTYTASSEEVLEAYRNMLYNGEWYVDCSVGGAQYGQGMYCAADYSGELSDGIKAEMKHYQELGQGRAVSEAARERASGLTKEDFDNNEYSRDAGITEEEVRVFAKLKSDPNLAGYKLPDDEKKVWREMISSGRMQDMNLAYSDMIDSFSKDYKAPFFVETMTLDPSAKVVKYTDIQTMKMNEGREFMERELSAYAASVGEECEAYFRVQTGKLQDGDFETAMKWQASNPEAMRAAESFRVETAKKANDVMVDALNMDVGVYAALKGYDAINAEQHGESGSYTVILNRTKTIILDGNIRDDDKGDSVIKFEAGENGIVYAVRAGKVIGWVKASDGIDEEK